MSECDRRDFVKKSALAASAAMGARYAAGSESASPSEGIPKRALGKTGQKLSMIGFGGIVVMNAEPKHAAKVVSEAVDRGVNYFDVAPSYGNAEEILGPALEPHRDGVFLACKTGEREKQAARDELEQSLKRMRTDHFDLYQLHAITDLEKDVKVALGPGGALETIVKAREEGKIRHIGFSAHSPEAALAAMEQFDFDSILYPINVICHFQSKFDQRPLELARKKDMGILALKAMARNPWDNATGSVKRDDYGKCWYEPLTTPEEALVGLRFTLSQEGLTAALPPGEEPLWRMAVDLVPKITPMSEGDLGAAEKFASGIKPIFS